MFRTDNQEPGNGDIWAIRPGVDTVARALVATPAEELRPEISPDGRWMAYSSDVSGRREIYVRAFPDAAGTPYQVSTTGGTNPMWSPTGKELFYIDAANNMVSVPVIPGAAFQVGQPQVLFAAGGYLPQRVLAGMGGGTQRAALSHGPGHPGRRRARGGGVPLPRRTEAPDGRPMTAAPDRLAAALADRYRIERELGPGGMATVYLAQDLKHDRKVALKVLRPELAAVIGAERFLTEIKTTANLQHPHILPLLDSGEAGGFVFYVMPYVEGKSLRDRLDREKQLSAGRRACASPARWPTRWSTRTGTASSTATSSPRTSCCTAGTRWWPTSASRWR